MGNPPDTEIPETLDTSDDATPVPLCYAGNTSEAGLICTRLRSGGIRAFVQDELVAVTFSMAEPAIHPRGVPVMVRRIDLEPARALLATPLDESVRQMLGPEGPAVESPEERDIRRGYWAALLGVFFCPGILLTIYSTWLLHRGRSAWRSPDPAIRRVCRRRIVIGWTVDALMVVAWRFYVRFTFGW